MVAVREGKEEGSERREELTAKVTSEKEPPFYFSSLRILYNVPLHVASNPLFCPVLYLFLFLLQSLSHHL